MPQLTNIQCEIIGKYHPELQKTIYRADIEDKDRPNRQVILSLDSQQNFNAFDIVTGDLIIFSVDGKLKLDELEDGDIISIRGCIPKPQA